jgi:hypothetical protein
MIFTSTKGTLEIAFTFREKTGNDYIIKKMS